MAATAPSRGIRPRPEVAGLLQRAGRNPAGVGGPGRRWHHPARPPEEVPAGHQACQGYPRREAHARHPHSRMCKFTIGGVCLIVVQYVLTP